MLAAPRVPPGTYEVRLTVAGHRLTRPFELRKDPRVQATDDDLREAYAWAAKAHDLLRGLHDAVLGLRDLRGQADGWASRTQVPRIRDAARALGRALTAIENELIQVRSDDPRMFPAKLNSRLATIVGLIEHSDAAPTQALRELYESLASRIHWELAELDRCQTEDVAAFNALCFDEGAPALVARSGPARA
jgi:hypothetical protein